MLYRHALILTVAFHFALGGALFAESPFRRPPPAPDPALQRPDVGELPAPTRLQSEPQVYNLLKLPGDHAQVRYTMGSLDRAASVQTRLELSARAFDRWSKHQVDYNVYVMSREEWDTAGYPVEYGVPVRVGRHGIATATLGDDRTVALWSELLSGRMPDVPGLPIYGTPAQAASLVVSDLLLQVQAAEILIDELGLGGDAHWVRGVVSHLAAAALTRRFEQRREPAVLELWRNLGDSRPLRSLAAEDYSADVSLPEWLWFQAQFRVGAMILLNEIGRGSLDKMRKLNRKGELTGRELLARWDALDEWHRNTFSGVPLRR